MSNTRSKSKLPPYKTSRTCLRAIIRPRLLAGLLLLLISAALLIPGALTAQVSESSVETGDAVLTERGTSPGEDGPSRGSVPTPPPVDVPAEGASSPAPSVASDASSPAQAAPPPVPANVSPPAAVMTGRPGEGFFEGPPPSTSAGRLKLWAGALAVVAAVALLASALSVRRRLRNKPDEPEVEVPVAEKTAPAGVRPHPPGSFFPDELTKRVDGEKLDEYLRQAEKAAVAEYFFALGESAPPADGSEESGPPAEAIVNSAAARAARLLNRSLTSPALFPLLTGGEGLGAAQEGLMVLHLNALLPPLRLPPLPADPGRPKSSAAALVAAIMAVMGNLFGGALVGLLGQPVETGALVGCAVGAAAGVLLSLHLAQNEKTRRALLGVLGGLALADVLLSVFKGTVLPGVLGGKTGFWKRLFFYLGAAAILFLVKGGRVCDYSAHRLQVRRRIEDYLRSAVPLVLVLLFGAGTGEGEAKSPSDGRDDEPPAEVGLVRKISSVVRRLRARGVFEDDPAFHELVRGLANAGYETGPPGAREEPLVWDESLASDYDTFGLVRAGQRVVVEEEPVRKDGLVVRRGLVRPK